VRERRLDEQPFYFAVCRVGNGSSLRNEYPRRTSFAEWCWHSVPISRKLIPSGLRDKLEGRKLNGADILLGYVNCTESGRRAGGRCPIVPYRQAELLNSERLGSVYLLSFRLNAFRMASDLESFQRTLPENSPRWKLGLDGQPIQDDNGRPIYEGFWCQEVSPDLQATVVTNKIQDWQTIVTQQRGQEDFADQPYFYMIEGLFRREQRRSPIRHNYRNVKGLFPHVQSRTVDVGVGLIKGEYRLQSRCAYELRIFHYDPDSDAHTGGKKTGWLKMDVSSPLMIPRSSPLLAIDSPYDRKSIHFSASETNRTEYGSLFIHTGKADTDTEEQLVPDLYLPATITSDVWAIVKNGFVLGFLLTITQLVTVFSRGIIPGWEVITVFIILLGFSTGLWVSWGMRKPM
jgi:hypothetical protein